jgi:hypothetical protein
MLSGQTKIAGVATFEERRFNHDLLIRDDDREQAKQRWPRIAHLLVNTDLVAAFEGHEATAKVLKRKVQRVGSAAVLLMVGSLIGTAALLASRHYGFDMEALHLAVEVFAIFGLIFAVLASRYGPWRRPWLRSRFMTEVLRQWHFRQLLDGQTVDLACRQPDQHSKHRQAELAAKLTDLTNEVGQRMDHLADSGFDALGRVPSPQLPHNSDARKQLLEAYRVLRLEHQLYFAAWKLSPADKTFLGLSSLALVGLTDLLAGATLLFALLISVARLLLPFDWASVAALSLAIVGVGVRTWRDGLALGDERERYQEMHHRLQLVIARWDAASTDERRFLAAEEVEQAAVEELRGFIRTHERAQFLL